MTEYCSILLIKPRLLLIFQLWQVLNRFSYSKSNWFLSFPTLTLVPGAAMIYKRYNSMGINIIWSPFTDVERHVILLKKYPFTFGEWIHTIMYTLNHQNYYYLFNFFFFFYFYCIYFWRIGDNIKLFLGSSAVTVIKRWLKRNFLKFALSISNLS